MAIPNENRRRHRIELLEGLRGGLSVWVMIGHLLYFLGIQATPSYQWLLTTARDGATPVALFMILSGFVIFYLLESANEPAKPYITRRFLRLFPAFFCCLILGIFATTQTARILNSLPWRDNAWIQGQAQLSQIHLSFALPNLLAHLTMLHGVIPRQFWPDATGAFLGVAWSISTEWQFYLLAYPAREARKRISLKGFFVVGLVLLFFINRYRYRLEPFINDMPSLVLFQAKYFFVGILSYYLYDVWAGSRPKLIAKYPVILVVATVVIMAACKFHIFSLWAFILTLMLVGEHAPESSPAHFARLVFCNKPLLFLGSISYSVYLAHWPVSLLLLSMWSHLPASFGVVGNQVLYFVLASAASISVAALLYHAIELPFIRWGKKLFHVKPIDPPAPLTPASTGPVAAV